MSFEFWLMSGTQLLLRELPAILGGSAKEKATPQDDSLATHAPKVSTPLLPFIVLQQPSNSHVYQSMLLPMSFSLAVFAVCKSVTWWL